MRDLLVSEWRFKISVEYQCLGFVFVQDFDTLKRERRIIIIETAGQNDWLFILAPIGTLGNRRGVKIDSGSHQ